VEAHDGLMVSVRVDLHAVEEAEIVGVFGEFGKRLGDHEPALSRGRKGEPRGEEPGCRRGRFGQFRPVIEGLVVARATVHEQEDDPFRPGGMVGALRGEGIGEKAGRPLRKERTQSQAAEGRA
jgi:hypothetical protein